MSASSAESFDWSLCGRSRQRRTMEMRPWDNPARAARRKAELCEQNGSEEVRCIYCGNTDPLVVRPRRIQEHHFLSRERDSVTAPVCLNCHAVAHEHIRDANIGMTVRERLPRHSRARCFNCWRFIFRCSLWLADDSLRRWIRNDVLHDLHLRAHVVVSGGEKIAYEEEQTHPRAHPSCGLTMHLSGTQNPRSILNRG